jgi:hypothetical protein
MADITKLKTREIIDDFAKEIELRKLSTAKPSKAVINFRTDIHDKKEREIWRVPINILRYRKENGRIASDILDYETNVGVFDEKDDQAQKVIADFLKEKDPEKTVKLRNSIIHAGQQEPAIITCDGFLINGNRRKMVMEQLHQDFPENTNYEYLNVVILPGKDDKNEGGPPTLVEIEKIENRYQLQSDGKSEYYGFDRALSIKRKIELGLTLEEQLRDDPNHAGATSTQLNKAVKECEKNYLKPLECVDRYLKQFKREGQYRTISSGMSDREGRWQAFIDYANTYSRFFISPKGRLELNIEEDEIGSIEEAAFDIIRLRTLPDVPKVHVIMRDLPKYCRTKEGKHEILKIAEDVENVLSKEQYSDNQGKPLTHDQIDAKWAANNQQSIIYHVKKARNFHETKKEKETPIELLETAYKKLTHDDMDLSSIAIADWPKARKLAADIGTRANLIEKEIYRYEKNYKDLGTKWKK